MSKSPPGCTPALYYFSLPYLPFALIVQVYRQIQLNIIYKLNSNIKIWFIVVFNINTSAFKQNLNTI